MLIAKKEFEADLVLEYSYTPTPKELGKANNTMEFHLHESGDTGCIIWDYELPDDFGQEVIGLWFEGKELTDYDGVFELPKEAIELLEENGYDADYAK